MITKALHCPTCGDVWKRVLHENFLRLGPPIRECRACWTPFATDAKEWEDLDNHSRIGFVLLQNIVSVLPILLLLILAAGIAYLLDMTAPADLRAYIGYGCLMLIALFIALVAWSGLMILRSKRRVSRSHAERESSQTRA